MDMGPCPKVHSLQLRKEYEEAKERGEDNYDRELEDKIDRLIVECERKIQRALKRLSEEDAKAAIAISVSEVTQVVSSWNELGFYFLPVAIIISRAMIPWRTRAVVMGPGIPVSVTIGTSVVTTIPIIIVAQPHFSCF